MPSGNKPVRTLILGIGNLLMSDEGIGVHVAQHLGKQSLPEGVECLDGGTGGFHLLDPMQQAERILLIDAAADDSPVGTVRRLRPRFSSDYPRTLTAHDIGLKDLLDTFYLLGESIDVTLFAVTISPQQEIGVGLSPEFEPLVPQISAMILAEL